MKKIIFITLFVIFTFGYVLRVIYLPKNSLTFGYDQARDAISSQQILAGHIKIQGPPASTPGLNHGVFYYYVLVPAYYFGHNPINAAYWIAFLSSLTIFTVFLLGYFLTQKIWAGIFTSFLFAISFEATQYSTWLSNPTIGMVTVPLIYLGLWVWISDIKVNQFVKKIAPAICAIGLGLSVQSEIFLFYQVIPVILWLWVARKNINRNQIFLFVSLFIISISSMIIAEVKFGFKSFSGILSLLTNQDAIVSSKGFGDFIVLFLNQIGRVFAFSSYPSNIGYGATLIVVLIFISLWTWNHKSNPISWQPFLATWLFSHATVASVGGTSTPFLLVGIAPAISLILGIIIYKWFASGHKLMSMFILTVLIFGNFAMIAKENNKGSTIFSIQKEFTLKNELSAIDFTYQESGKKPFSINSLTSPLWINIVWTYLYKWYGMEKYGYVPEWHGRDQIGQLDSLPTESKSTKQYFLIIEPMDGIPARYLDETIQDENHISTLIKEEYFGQIRVQERIKK